MKKLSRLFPVFACLALVALVMPTEIEAQILVPCCEGGFKPGKKCSTDSNCPNICIGGFRDGKPCNNAGSNCPPACVGGSQSGSQCNDDADCPDGGTCSDMGACMVGTCTDLCEKKPPKPTPSEPMLRWSDQIDDNVYTPEPCP